MYLKLDIKCNIPEVMATVNYIEIRYMPYIQRIYIPLALHIVLFIIILYNIVYTLYFDFCLLSSTYYNIIYVVKAYFNILYNYT